MFDLSLYKPTYVENWIEEVYQANGILTPNDMDIERIAEVFGGKVVDTKAKSHVRWEDDEDIFFVIFLNNALDELSKRSDFHHELCHPLQHAGNQERIPESFKELQERQARTFQLYAAIPFFMLKKLPIPQYENEAIDVLSNEFRVPYELAAERLHQIKRRLLQVRLDIQFTKYIQEEEQKINGEMIPYKFND
ncbi:ImmA/IrrE family metallo-endopeptidase [Aneurinibacillus aneurinilyticus]|uniref:ImmA/IrrE family metallo-endopeptidase n=1 Tax=Aneurinibacillus aneurinilyticus TaxID=1391 RepID=UPI003524FCE7